ncbi:DEAD/DEAH box helicase family protein [Rhizobium rhizogenes]|uniref:DEAD/DEAH box helicase family protein n=1 Tax=Rhizobium rhizogenes TaxID=359 RepID=UPI00157442FC|nr:DEAD/DEAH box helicase family protein [Rhizobium rhizogenes]NTF63412.1 DEAD/DEAH box helicase family protein [Rhizobium rhizogenes]NTG94744.1 DEAD/DEAH box helicase family protein [Rhizobium rhizogenes]
MIHPDRIRRQIAQRLSLRKPQERALSILAELLDGLPLGKNEDVADALAAVQKLWPSVEAFERDFPSLCFALATGVGKTRLMGAFISYLYLTGRSKNFFVLAPNTTIYDKLVADFSRQSSPKYVFRGIAEFAQHSPTIVTGDTWEEGRGIRGSDLFGNEVMINIFNVDKINKDKGRIRTMREYIGQSYFDYLAELPDLVMLMDEAHRYRANAGMRAISELKPILGLELTATPKSVGGKSKAFNNVIYQYGLGDAMADGYVKEPAVATRVDFRPQDYDQDTLEMIMLEDGIHYHEEVKTQLDLYARQTGRKRVHPFILVVAQDTKHAGKIRANIEDDTFLKGAYKGRVIEIHSNLKGEESDEAISRLVKLESDDQTEIVIHVNKLKEGWDVTNLYTIVPLRASASDILTEQTLGRGLRLPYGERTGNEFVDTLTVIAHDRFDEVIRKAREADSLVQMRAITIGPTGDVKPDTSYVIEIPTAIEAMLTGKSNGMDDEGQAFVFDHPGDQQVAATAIEFIAQKYERKLTGGVLDLIKPEVQAEIVADIRHARREQVQGTLEGVLAEPDFKKIVGIVTASIAENTIEIPEIVVIPSREVNFWFEDFDLGDLSNVRHQPISDKIRIRNLRDQTQHELARSVAGPREARIENYIVKHLIDMDQIDYDTQADLLYKLAGQMVEHLRSYLATEEDVENVALAHGRSLALLVFEQMKKHYRETPTEYRAKMVRSFRMLRSQSYAIYSTAKRLPISQAAKPLAETPNYVFFGTQRSPYLQHKFDSDAERRFAALIDHNDEKNVLRWLKPATGQFQIEYRAGKAYEPDFVVETADEKLIIEVKSDREMQDSVVQEKARAAVKWVQYATELAEDTNGKAWGYALVADSDITESASFLGLMARSRLS